jgi:hypothetical protein
MRHGMFRAEELGAQIDLEHPLVIGFGDLRNVAGVLHAGVLAERVEAAQPFDAIGDERWDALFLGDVAGDEVDGIAELAQRSAPGRRRRRPLAPLRRQRQRPPPDRCWRPRPEIMIRFFSSLPVTA